MTRTLLVARLLLGAILIAYAGWFLAAGWFAAPLVVRAAYVEALEIERQTQIVYTTALSIILSVLLHARLPLLAVAARWHPLRASGWAAVLGALGLWLGISLHWREALGVWLLGGPPEPTAFLYVRIASGLVLILGVVSIAMPRATDSPWFLTDRSHATNRDVRRALAAGLVHALATILAMVLLAAHPPLSTDRLPFPEMLFLYGGGYVAGILAASRQKYPQRQMGLMPWSAILTAISALAVWSAPESFWPAVVLGFALGLGHLPARSATILFAPADQRARAAACLAIAQLVGVALAVLTVWLARSWGLSAGGGRGLFFGFCLAMAAAGACFYFRELFEATLDMTLGLNYVIRAHGPGVFQIPSRGPALVIANHGAMFDPLWLSKIVPTKVTALMTSKFYDLPIIHFLVKNVMQAIRVPDVAFRREAPEIQDAIAALQRGQLVMIFPEGWLRRKDTVPLRRFGQGVFQVLKAAPSTPVIACWLEGSWGSYTSYWNGPPGKNKRFDLRRRIDIGVCEPEVLPSHLLDDQHAVRGYLAKLVLKARSYLGLPELLLPEFTSVEEENGRENDEPDAANNSSHAANEEANGEMRE